MYAGQVSQCLTATSAFFAKAALLVLDSLEPQLALTSNLQTQASLQRLAYQVAAQYPVLPRTSAVEL